MRRRHHGLLAAAAASLALAGVAAPAHGAAIVETAASTSPTALADWIATGPGGAVFVTLRTGNSSSSIVNMSAKPAITTQCVFGGSPCAIGAIVELQGGMWFASTIPINTQSVHEPPSIGNLTLGPPPLATLVQRLGQTDLPYSVAADPAGALWVAQGQGVVARYVPGETEVTNYPLPVPSAGPLAITLGPDGAMWMTQTTANTISRISTGEGSPTGTYTEFAVPSPRSGLYGIAAGPDGAVWFAESQTGRIGRITTAGAITEFQIPIKNASPRNLVAGPDGAIWFTDPGTNAVGRMTVEGKVTEYPLKTPRSVPNAITVGGDGLVWFTEAANKAMVGRIAPGSPPSLRRSVQARVTGAKLPAAKRKAAAKKKQKSKAKRSTKKKAAKKQRVELR